MLKFREFLQLISNFVEKNRVRSNWVINSLRKIVKVCSTSKWRFRTQKHVLKIAQKLPCVPASFVRMWVVAGLGNITFAWGIRAGLQTKRYDFSSFYPAEKINREIHSFFCGGWRRVSGKASKALALFGKGLWDLLGNNVFLAFVWTVHLNRRFSCLVWIWLWSAPWLLNSWLQDTGHTCAGFEWFLRCDDHNFDGNSVRFLGCERLKSFKT